MDNILNHPYAFGLGIYLITAFMYFVYQNYKVRNWAITEGKVLNITIQQDNDTDSTMFRRVVLYEYYVNGERYTSDQITKGVIWWDGLYDWAKRRNLEYQPGNNVTVYYNPKHPKDAVLETAFEAYTFIYFFIGIAAILSVFINE